MPQSKVSVIITAYNRKEWVYQAIESVLNQTLDRSMFEVIVVSNFGINVANIPNDLDLTNIIMNGNVGEFLCSALEAAKYEIVTFLDDDDTFTSLKLEKLIEIFSNYPDVCFYHNGLKYVDKQLQDIDYVRLTERRGQLSKVGHLIVDPSNEICNLKKAIEIRGDFNLSSITIRRKCSMKYLNLLRQIEGGTDAFFFWITLVTQGQLMIESQQLTNYRVYESNVSGQIDYQKKVNELGKQIHTYDLILNFINMLYLPAKTNEILKRWIYLYKYEYEMMKLMFGDSNKNLILKQMIKILLFGHRYSNTLKNRILLFASISLANKNLARNLYLRAR